MPFMHNMSIKHKLISIIMLTCVAALLLAGGVFVVTEWATQRRAMVRNISTHAAMAADNCKAALAFEDVNDAKETLSTLKEEPSIILACVYDKDGEEAVEQAQSRDFDLILMDMQMPNLNGYEATKKLRKEGIRVPIVALTANAMKGDDKKCLAAGCDDYISKPLDRARLIEVVGKYLQAKESEVCKGSSAEA